MMAPMFGNFIATSIISVLVYEQFPCFYHYISRGAYVKTSNFSESSRQHISIYELTDRRNKLPELTNSKKYINAV